MIINYRAIMFQYVLSANVLLGGNFHVGIRYVRPLASAAVSGLAYSPGLFYLRRFSHFNGMYLPETIINRLSK